MSLENLLKKALLKHQSGNYDGAAKHYQEILRIKPSHLDANYLLGTLYAETGNIPEAIRFLTAAEKICPDSPYIKVNLANIHKLQGDYEAARTLFSQAVTLKNDLAEAYLGLGNISEIADNDSDAALLYYEKAISLSHDTAESYQVAGKIYLKAGKPAALDYFRKALQLNPKLANIHKDLGLAYVGFGRKLEAVSYLRQALAKTPDDVHVKYFLCIAEGEIPEPELQSAFAQSEFDDFAISFDNTLVNQLGYSAPEQLIELIKRNAGDSFHFHNAADLGCGTGLFGMAIRQHVDYLAGMDISPKMVALARKRGCYDALLEGDLTSLLLASEMVFDLFAATDVLVYIGDLQATFQAITSRAAPGALLVFSTEALEGEGFVMQNTGRYAHSREYINTVAAQNGCTVLDIEQIQLRKEHGNWIMGDLFLIKVNQHKGASANGNNPA